MPIKAKRPNPGTSWNRGLKLRLPGANKIFTKNSSVISSFNDGAITELH